MKITPSGPRKYVTLVEAFRDEKGVARQRVVLVNDRGLLSLDSLQSMSAIKVGERPLEFILAGAARRYADFEDILGGFTATPANRPPKKSLASFSGGTTACWWPIDPVLQRI